MVVELVFSAMHGERFQTCEINIFKNIDGKSFSLNFPWEIVFSTHYVTTDDWVLTSCMHMVAKIDFDFPNNSDSDQMGC